ncbi:hypothetical protein D3C76_105430 [compost metagenome]
MKSYISTRSLQIQGKPWQIKMILSQWQKDIGPAGKVVDVIQSSRIHRYSEVNGS